MNAPLPRAVFEAGVESSIAMPREVEMLAVALSKIHGRVIGWKKEERAGRRSVGMISAAGSVRWLKSWSQEVPGAGKQAVDWR